jgi:nucleoside-diphosphate-sugar epimerase
MTTLVLGGSGFISSALVRRLAARGDRVSTLTRRGHHAPPGAQIESLTGDRSDPNTLDRLFRARTFDVVYDMIAYVPEESAAAAALFRGRVGRFIHCSTVSVYMVSDAVVPPVTEDQDAAPVMAFWDRNPFGMTYGLRKRECEHVLWKAHDERQFPVTMIRPTFVSGPGDPAGRDAFWIDRILDGGPLLIPGDGETRFQTAYVEDVARVLAELPLCAVAIGKAYNVADEESLTMKEYIARLASLLDKQPPSVYVTQEVFDRLPFSTSLDGDVFPFNTRRDAVFSLERIKHDLGYRSTPLRTWLSATVEWRRQTPGFRSTAYDRRWEEVEFAGRWIRQQERIHP